MNKENHLIPVDFSINDFCLSILPAEIKKNSLGKRVIIISDFDETQCSTYNFSEGWNTHVPKIRADLTHEAKQLINPLCIATARTATEKVTWLIWHQLSKQPMPLITENGAALVWPTDKISQKPTTEILATPEQQRVIQQIQLELEKGLIKKLNVCSNHEVILRTGRLATVELRAQETDTKKGTPDDHREIETLFKLIFPEAIPLIDIINSGNSLGIQPKGVSKATGIKSALDRADIELDTIFPVGLGDNQNDATLFDFVKQNNGITIGVRPTTQGLCDFTFDGGDQISFQVLQTINRLTKI